MPRPLHPRGRLVSASRALYPDQVRQIELLEGDFAENLRALVDLGLWIRNATEQRATREAVETGLEDAAHWTGSIADRTHHAIPSLVDFVVDLLAVLDGGQTAVGLPARAAWNPELEGLQNYLEGWGEPYGETTLAEARELSERHLAEDERPEALS